jgi:hypothetical protein
LKRNGFIAQYDRVQIMGQGKDKMEIAAGKQLGFAIIEPSLLGHTLTLGTMSVSAGVIGDTLKSAFIALLNMTAEGSGSAGFDTMHDLDMIVWQSFIPPIHLAIALENVCDLQLVWIFHNRRFNYISFHFLILLIPDPDTAHQEDF